MLPGLTEITLSAVDHWIYEQIGPHMAVDPEGTLTLVATDADGPDALLAHAQEKGTLTHKPPEGKP